MRRRGPRPILTDEFKAWLAERGYEPSETYRLEITLDARQPDARIKVFRYARNAEGKFYFDARGRVQTLRPVTLTLDQVTGLCQTTGGD